MFCCCLIYKVSSSCKYLHEKKYLGFWDFFSVFQILRRANSVSTVLQRSRSGQSGVQGLFGGKLCNWNMMVHLHLVDISVVRNSTRLQSSKINWYFGSSDATTHKILPSSESRVKENWWCQPEERFGWNGKNMSFWKLSTICVNFPWNDFHPQTIYILRKILVNFKNCCTFRIFGCDSIPWSLEINRHVK